MGMFPIASTTLGSSAQVTFDNIPQTFTHLQVRVVGRDASATTINAAFIVFNGSFETYPVSHYLSGNGSSASAGTNTTVLIPLPVLPGANASSNIAGSIIIDILDYSNTGKNKAIRAIGGADLNGSGTVEICSGFRINTQAITSLTLGGAFNSPYQFAAGTRVDLYGITTSQETGA